jgi:membrane protein DedA with SNARE-associated domain
MSLVGVVIAGTLGSWFGSVIMYVAARWAVGPRFFDGVNTSWCRPDKLARAEVFMHRYEAGGIFFARLLRLFGI